MAASGLFEEIFRDYKKPEKDVIGKLSDAYRKYEEFVAPKNELERNIQGMVEQWNPAGIGIIAGPSVVRNAVKQSPTYAKKVAEYFDMLRGLPRNLFEAVDPTNRPGLYSGELFFRPEVKQGYDLTGIVPLPYTQLDDMGKRRLVYGLDQGRVRIKLDKLSEARDMLKQGNGIRMSNILDAPGAEMMEDVYPGWLDRFSLQLHPDAAMAQDMVGNGSISYDALRNLKGVVTINNPKTLDEHNLPFLDRLINHEVGGHGAMSMGGLPSGSNANLFNENWSKRYGALPVGFGDKTPYEMYLRDLGEVMATSQESLKPNVIDNIRMILGKPKSDKWGTDYPIVIRERMKHPISSESYDYPNQHFGYDIKNFYQKIGRDWEKNF